MTLSPLITIHPRLSKIGFLPPPPMTTLEIRKWPSKTHRANGLVQRQILRGCSQGLQKFFNWIDKTYKRPEIYILENGTSLKGEDELPLEQIPQDEFRYDFYRDHIGAVVRARNENGINILGYTAWSLMDNFEWSDGFRVRFGATYVDYQNDVKRYPKQTAILIAGLFRKYIGN